MGTCANRPVASESITEIKNPSLKSQQIKSSLARTRTLQKGLPHHGLETRSVLQSHDKAALDGASPLDHPF